MSLRLETLQAARLAPNLLRDSAALVRDFVESQRDDSGGFRGRGGEPDLYYTVFGLDSLVALRADPDGARTAPFLDGFGDGEGLDLVHTACLARCWAAAGLDRLPQERRLGLLERLAGFRRESDKPPVHQVQQVHDVHNGPRDLEKPLGETGGYAPEPGGEPTVYASFLAAGAFQDLGEAIPAPEGLAAFLEARALPGGGYANDARPGSPASTPVTAAAAELLRTLGRSPAPGTADWLLGRLHPKGGFLAIPAAPMPDLLSTAVALHALAGMNRPLRSAAKEACLDFIDTLWSARGGFLAHWAEDQLDVEYVYYGLLALGHLSL